MLDLNKNGLALGVYRAPARRDKFNRTFALSYQKLLFLFPTRRRTSPNIFPIRAANGQIYASASFPTIGPSCSKRNLSTITKFRLNFLIGGYARNRVSGCDWSTNRTRSGKVVGNCCLRGVASGYVTQSRNYVAGNFDVKTVTRFFDVSLMLIIRSD